MSSGLLGIAVVLFVAGAVLAGRAWVDARLRARARAHWQEGCALAGLTVRDADDPGFSGAEGTIQGLSVRAWVDELRTRGVTHQFVRLRVDMEGVPELFIRRRMPEHERSTWTEVRTGDAAFDETVRVTAPHTGPAHAWLSSKRRATLLSLGARYTTWSIGDGALGLSQRGLAASPDKWREQVHDLVGAARSLATR